MSNDSLKGDSEKYHRDNIKRDEIVKLFYIVTSSILSRGHIFLVSKGFEKKETGDVPRSSLSLPV